MKPGTSKKKKMQQLKSLLKKIRALSFKRIIIRLSI